MGPFYTHRWTNFGAIWGPKSCPKRGPNIDQKGNRFWNRFLRLSEGGKLPRPAFCETVALALGVWKYT